MNDLMCVSISSLLRTPLYHALLRSAGSRGNGLYESMWRDGLVPLAAIVEGSSSSREGDDEPPMYHHVPLVHPTSMLKICQPQYRPLRSKYHSYRTDEEDEEEEEVEEYADEEEDVVRHVSFSIAISCIEALSIDIDTFDMTTLFDMMVVGRLLCTHCTDLVLLSEVIQLMQPRTIAFDESMLAHTHLPQNFLSRCPETTSIDLTNFDFVEELPLGFLNSAGILSIDVVSLTRRLRVLPSSFLEDLPYLQSINLAPLSRFTSIPPLFLSGAISLRQLDLTPLGNVTSVGEGFLLKCGVEELDLAPLSNLETIPPKFLAGLKNLKRIDLRPLSKITIIPVGVLCHCHSLEEVGISDEHPIESVGEAFLKGCKLSTFDFTPLRNITTFPESLLAHSPLTSIDLSPLVNITSIAPRFLQFCSLLTSVDLAPLRRITQIPMQFMWMCKSLSAIDLSALVDVEVVEEQFMFGCGAVKLVRTPRGNTALHDAVHKHIRGTPTVEEV